MESSRRDGVLCVKPSEEEIGRPVDLHSAFADLILQDEERRIVVDLSEVRTLTSLMIGALVSLHLLAYENLTVLTFENMHPRIKTLLELIGVDTLVEAHYGKGASPPSRPAINRTTAAVDPTGPEPGVSDDTKGSE